MHMVIQFQVEFVAELSRSINFCKFTEF